MKKTTENAPGSGLSKVNHEELLKEKLFEMNKILISYSTYTTYHNKRHVLKNKSIYAKLLQLIRIEIDRARVTDDLKFPQYIDIKTAFELGVELKNAQAVAAAYVGYDGIDHLSSYLEKFIKNNEPSDTAEYLNKVYMLYTALLEIINFQEGCITEKCTPRTLQFKEL